MIKLLRQALFVLPVIAIVAAPVILHIKNKDTKQEYKTYTTAKNSDNASVFSKFNPFFSSSVKKDYSMQEPFSTAGLNGMTYSMRKSMDPSTWMQMMTSMMNPHGVSPEAMCVSCHEGDDIARYKKQFGPMLQSSWNQYQTMMDPHGMAQMMNPTMMTQMMHQMMAIPMQMMMPMMNSGLGLNPHMGMPTNPHSSIPNVMNPKQYEEWYNEQQK